MVTNSLYQRGNLVAFAYFYHAQQKEQYPSKTLASLLRQVLDFGLKNNSSFVPMINRFYKSFSGTSTYPKSIELQIILECVFQEYGRPVYLCLDALDEYSENKDHIDELLSCLTSLPTNVKLFVTSREIGNLSTFLGNSQSIQQAITPQRSDIRSYARERVARDMPRYLDMIDEISDKVAESAMQIQS